VLLITWPTNDDSSPLADHLGIHLDNFTCFIRRNYLHSMFSHVFGC